MAPLALVGNATYAAVKYAHEFIYLWAALGRMLQGLPGYFFWSRRQTCDSGNYSKQCERIHIDKNGCLGNTVGITK